MTTVFVDTNVFVYARDASETAKQPLAMAWVSELWAGGQGRVSAQVLTELYVSLTQKLRPGMPVEAARADVGDLDAWAPLAVDRRLISHAWQVQDRFGFSYWDSMIVAAAQALNCDYLLTEDLSDGQDLGGVVVISPFTREPGSVLRS